MERSKNRLTQMKNMLEDEGSSALKYIYYLPIAACVTDKDGIFREVNTAYCRFYGYSAEQLLGNHFSMVVPKDEQKELSRLHDKFMGQEYELASKWKVITSKGDIRQVLANAAYIVDSDRSPYKITFLVDITGEQERLQELQVAVDKMKEQIKSREIAESTLLHDIRKPIASILGVVQLMQTADDIKDQQKWLDMIPDLANQALSRAEAFLGIHKMENGVYELKLGEVDLQDQIKKVYELTQRDAFEYKVNLNLEVEDENDEPVRVMGDAPFLEILFDNLVLNAIEASPKGGTVTSIIRPENEKVKVTVHSDSVIPEEIKDNFFAKYVTEGKEKGTGLGTYISHLIAKEHNGNIEYTTSEAAGTDITVILPKKP